jgi:hypothetical protein
MIAGEGKQRIRRSAKDICEFILDFEQYRKADTKIARVHSARWSGDTAEVRYSGRFRGFATPPVRQLVTVERHRRIDVRSKPGTFAHLVAPFHGLFLLEELGEGTTEVFHREALDPPVPIKWLIEPLLRRWLEEDTPAEMVRLKQLLEAPPPSP